MHLFFWPLCAACGILVPRPRIEPVPPALEAWSPNHWTAREVPRKIFISSLFYSVQLRLLFPYFLFLPFSNMENKSHASANRGWLSF